MQAQVGGTQIAVVSAGGNVCLYQKTPEQCGLRVTQSPSNACKDPDSAHIYQPFWVYQGFVLYLWPRDQKMAVAAPNISPAHKQALMKQEEDGDETQGNLFHLLS